MNSIKLYRIHNFHHFKINQNQDNGKNLILKLFAAFIPKICAIYDLYKQRLLYSNNL